MCAPNWVLGLRYDLRNHLGILSQLNHDSYSNESSSVNSCTTTGVRVHTCEYEYVSMNHNRADFSIPK